MSVAKQENQRLRRYIAIAHTAAAPLHRQRLRRCIYLTHGLGQSVIWGTLLSHVGSIDGSCGRADSAMPPKFAGRTEAEWEAFRTRQTQEGRIQELLGRPAKKAKVDESEEEDQDIRFDKNWHCGFCLCRECGSDFMIGDCGERISGAFADRGKGLCYDCIDNIGSQKLPLFWTPTTRPDHFSRKRKQGR